MIASVAGLLRQTISHQQILPSCTFRTLATSAQKRAAKRIAVGKPVMEHDGVHLKPYQSPKNIHKAPHMAKDAIKKKGVIDHFKEAPFIPMVVIFPTMMMGAALIIRPDLRAQFWGGGKKNSGMNKTIPTTKIPTTTESAEYIEENIAFQEIQNIPNERPMGPSRSVDIDGAPGDMEPLQRAIASKDENADKVARDLIYAIGIRPHPSL